MERITLYKALMSKRIPEFIEQEEARGIGPIDRAAFDGAITGIIKEPRLEDRTSRSASAGNSSGKRTHRDSGPDASS